MKAVCSSHKLITRKLLSLGYLNSLGKALAMRERQGCRSESIEGAIWVTWVINASVGCALGVLAGAVGIVLGDDGLARRAPLCALLPLVRHANKGE